MEKAKLERGMALLKEIDGAGGEAVLASLADIAPDLGEYIAAFAFGEIYGRAVLTL